MKTALVIMAAGLGSRFGEGIKQLTPVGPNGEIIIDYSIYDAIQAGFNKIIIILRQDIFGDFQEIIGKRVEKMCENLGVEIHYAFQDMKDTPIPVREDRTKPLGTGHAVLAARHLIKEPFVVINADDYYGKTAFKELHDFIITSEESCMAGFILKNTLSENGGVSRGICDVDNNCYLRDIVETHHIQRSGDVAVADGVIINLETYASMNMWGLRPEFIKTLETEFKDFLDEHSQSLKEEFLLPKIVGKLLNNGDIKVKVLPTPDKWVGVTYKEDKPHVIKTIKEMVDAGIYPNKL